VRTKDSCWSVGMIYDPRELPGVSTVGPGIGRGVTVLASPLIEPTLFSRRGWISIGHHTSTTLTSHIIVLELLVA
jgi:hypothetical protein